MEQTTKERLLDTAEQLFASYGFDGVSIRQIVSEAGANLAAVHYHFKSKEALLDAVVMRKATPVNDERLALLNRFEAEAGSRPIVIERVLEAFLQPIFSIAESAPHIIKLIGRMHAEGIMSRLMRTHFQPVVMRFNAAMHRALPGLAPDELLCRMEFCVGAMVAALNAVSYEGQTPQKREQTAARLLAFLAAGLRAPSLKTTKR